MRRRSGQVGYEEIKGGWYHARFRMDVAGQEKRVYKSVPICPVSGPGTLSKSERLRRRREIIAASGADTEEHFNKIEAVNHGVTFRKQSQWWLDHIQARKRKPIAPGTAQVWANHLSKWIDPLLGDLPLSEVNNLVVKGFVSKLSDAGLSAKSIHNMVQIVKMVVASSVNENGEQNYPRKWNHGFIDLPEIKHQKTPTFTSETITSLLASTKKRRYRVLFALLGGTGLRVGEVLGIEIGKHISQDCKTLFVRQKVWKGRVQNFLKTGNGVREVDLDPSLAAMLKDLIGDRTSGFVFATKVGKPLSQRNLLKVLHSTLEKMEHNRCGFHAFRRYRVTHLRKNRAPEDLIRFWMGHANRSISDSYSKVNEDVNFRLRVSEEIGLGFEIPSEKPNGAPNAPKVVEEVPEDNAV